MSWNEYDDIEVDPERHSGTPVLKGTRVPASAIIENFDGFVEEGINNEYSMMLTFACFPSVSLGRIHALLAYRDSHDLELQT